MAVDPITGTIFTGVMDALGGATDTQNQINQDYTASRNTAEANYVSTINDRERYLADTANQRDMLDYGRDVNQENLSNQAALSLFDRNYDIANMQAGYDKFEAEFGDMQDNVYNTMKRLSSHSMEAQINDSFNQLLGYEMDQLHQKYQEMGVNPSSGFYQASQIQLKNQAMSDKIKQTRNLDTEVAMTQQNFMNTAAENKYFVRPEDFDKGILTPDQRAQLVQQQDITKASEYDINSYDVEKATVEKAEREKFLGIF